MSSGSLASNLLLRPVRDVYGRHVGRVINISFNSSGDMTAIQVEQGSEDIAEYPTTQVSMNSDSVVLIPRWKVDAKVIQKEWSSTQRKIFALDSLLKSGKISHIVYESLRKQEFEAVINRLRKKREALLNGLRSRCDELILCIDKYERSIVKIELERMVGEINDQTFKTAYDSMKSLLDSAMSEKRDIEAALDQLARLDRSYL